MNRIAAMLLCFILYFTAFSTAVLAAGNDTSEGQYSRIGEDYDILNQHLLLSKKDGTVWTWKTDELVYKPGNPGVSVYKASLRQIRGLHDVKHVSVNSDAANYNQIFNYVAVKKDGTVWYWDRDNPTDAPVLIEDLEGVASVVADFNAYYGFKSLFALKTDGSVWYWSSDQRDSRKTSAAPVQKKLLGDVVSIQSAGDIVYAVKKDGTVWSWSTAGYFGLTGSISSRQSSPERILKLDGIVDMNPGYYANYAIKQDATVWFWKTDERAPNPVQVDQAKGARTIVKFNEFSNPKTGKNYARRNAYALRTDGQLWSLESDQAYTGLNDIVSIHTDGEFTMKMHYYALKKDQTLWLWEYPSTVPKLVLFTEKTAAGDSPAAKPAPPARPEISLSPFIAMLQPGEKQYIAVNNLLPGTRIAYTVDDPDIATVRSENGNYVIQANKSGQTILRATASRAGFPDATAYMLLYVADRAMLTDTYFAIVQTLPATDKSNPIIVEGLTQAGEFVITASSSEKPALVNGQLVLTRELIDRLAGNGLKVKSAVERTLSDNRIVLARKLIVNGELVYPAEQNEYSFKIYKDSLINRNDLDYITVHAGDAKLMLSVATADRLFGSHPAIMIRLIKELGGGYRVQFADEQGKEISELSGNIRLILPVNDTDAERNSVFYMNGARKQPIGGKLNPNRNGMEAEIKRSGVYTLADNAQTFPDVDGQGDPELKQAVEFLASKGIVDGKDNGEFEPDSLLTRAEFTAMLVRAFYALDETATAHFSDVQPPHWHYPYIASSEKQRIVEGYPDGTFKPDNTISREEMTAIGARSLHEKMNYFYPANTQDYLDQFADQETISDWAKPTMALAVKERLIDVPADKQIKAREAVTRGEAVRMLYRLYVKLQ